MLLGGDEMGRTQGGNNNAYCQDNEVSWCDWEHARPRPGWTFTGALIALRRAHPVLMRRNFFQGRPIHGRRLADIAVVHPGGTRDDRGEWDDGARQVARRVPQRRRHLSHGAARRADRRRQLPAAVQRPHEALPFTLPPDESGADWEVVAGHRHGRTPARGPELKPGEALEVAAPARWWSSRRRTCADASDVGRAAATYRLQLHAGFDFDAAAEVAAYLAALGVSPRLLLALPAGGAGQHPRLRRHRPHPGQRRPGRAEAPPAAWCEALGPPRAGRRCSTSCPTTWPPASGNPWWWDVLENGRASRYAATSTSTGSPPRPSCAARCCCRCWATATAGCWRRGELAVEREGGAVRGHLLRPPLPARRPAPSTACWRRPRLRCEHDELAFLAHSLSACPCRTDDPPGDRTSATATRRCWPACSAELCRREPGVADALDDVLDDLNADADALHALLERQNYRLAHWKTAAQELDYRRFFDIATLVGLRIEDETVLARRARAGARVAGRRHARRRAGRPPRRPARPRAATPTACAPPPVRGAWIVVEKILTGDEQLPRTWPVDGTTGYDFLNRVLWLFVDPRGPAPRSTSLYRRYTGDERPSRRWPREAEREVLRTLLAADVERITNLLAAGVRAPPPACATSPAPSCARCVIEVAASSTCTAPTAAVDDDGTRPASTTPTAPASPRRSPAAIAAARPRRRAARVRARGARPRGGRATPEQAVALRFQQLTGPATAKGVEDTAFYRSTGCWP